MGASNVTHWCKDSAKIVRDEAGGAVGSLADVVADVAGC